MTPSADCPILIVGAGPVGLTAAIELARRGFRPRIVSASDGPVHESRALGVNRRTLQLLQPCGAAERIVAAGLRIAGLRFRTAEREIFRIPVPPGDGLPLLTILPQSEIEHILVGVLRSHGVEVEWRTRLAALRSPESRPQADLEGPGGAETVTCDLLIAADGAHSVARHELGLAFHGSAYETAWGLADVRVTTQLPLSEGHIFDLAPVLFVVLPIRGDLVRFICDQPDVMNHVPPPFTVRSVAWQSPFRISHRQTETYQRGAVFLAGDAAHIHSPIGARGMNLGIEDAAWLAWMIAEGTTDGYTAARRPVGRRVLKTVDPATRLMASDAALPKFIRRRILPLVVGNDALRRRMIGRIVGLDTPPPPPWLAAR